MGASPPRHGATVVGSLPPQDPTPSSSDRRDAANAAWRKYDQMVGFGATRRTFLDMAEQFPEESRLILDTVNNLLTIQTAQMPGNACLLYTSPSPRDS